jgi:hypothetical protein
VKHFDSIADDAEPQARIYTVCSFEPGSVVPQVHLIDALNDGDALFEARARHAFMVREVWDRHRLVGVIQPAD